MIVHDLSCRVKIDLHLSPPLLHSTSSNSIAPFANIHSFVKMVIVNIPSSLPIYKKTQHSSLDDFPASSSGHHDDPAVPSCGGSVDLW